MQAQMQALLRLTSRKPVQLRASTVARTPLTRKSGVGISSGFSTNSQRELRGDIADIKQRVAALSDTQGRLTEREILRELGVRSGAEFRNAYEVARYIVGEQATDQERDAAVDRLATKVIDQDAGALGLLRMLQGQIRKDTKPRPQSTGPLTALWTAMVEWQSSDAWDAQVEDATKFMEHAHLLQPKEILMALQNLRSLLLSKVDRNNKGWWETYVSASLMYYGRKLGKGPEELKECVTSNFVMFALPVALDAMVLRSPVEVLEIDALWPLVFTGPWSCDIRVGEVKSRATADAVNQAGKQLERSLLFLEWACRLIHGDTIKVSLTGVIATINAGPEKHRLPRDPNPGSKVKYVSIKV